MSKQTFSFNRRRKVQTAGENGAANRSIVRPDGRVNIEKRGIQYSRWRDFYHWMLNLSWLQFFGLLVGAYLLTNLLFACAYLLVADSIANARPGSLLDAFYFSVQTMATIGYGAMYPKNDYANFLVAIEALFGLLGVAMATGLMFARFTRPTAKVMISRVAVITQQDGVPTLMFRAANRRGNQILEARLWVTLIRDEVTLEGHPMRRIHDLKLVRNQTPFFELSWTAMHPIDETSPLYGVTPASLAESESVITVILTGMDETVAQSIYARQAYTPDTVLWNMRFVDLFGKTAEGLRYIDYSCFHRVMPIVPSPE